MLRKPLDQLPQKRPFTLAVDLDELIQLTDLADSLGITRHALGLRMLRIGFKYIKAEHATTLQQVQG